MDECIDLLGEARIFSTLNTNYSYWQVKINGSDWEKTALTSPHGLYQFTNIVLTEERAHHLQKENDRYFFLCEVAIDSRLPGRYFRCFEIVKERLRRFNVS